MHDDPAVSVSGLFKSYAGVPAVRGISFDIAPGETFALLGPNGAGKTSTIEILEGYRKRTAGHVNVLGFDPGENCREFRECIGLVLQSTALEPELTVIETVTAFSQFYPEPLRVEGLLKTVGLADRRDNRVRTLSGGQQRRLEIALGLIGNPEVVFLDEPTTGLDPDARAGVWHLIRKLSQKGKTVILSSHHMEEVEALAHRLAILVAGKICASGTVADLLHEFGGHSRFSFWWPFDQLPYNLPPALGSLHHGHDNWVSFSVAEPGKALVQLTGWAHHYGVNLDSLTITKPTLEDIYLSLTGARQKSGGPDR